ncbi:hypothetical protein HOD38_02855 [archaeon]|jgi:hypothetical protein|nr:hypothetical protein [archaeon]MBT4397181.1 hypothetical protein [archaeon]MBT4440561.1 hypothetical protein [archaeon]
MVKCQFQDSTISYVVGNYNTDGDLELFLRNDCELDYCPPIAERDDTLDYGLAWLCVEEFEGDPLADMSEQEIEVGREFLERNDYDVDGLEGTVEVEPIEGVREGIMYVADQIKENPITSGIFAVSYYLIGSWVLPGIWVYRWWKKNKTSEKRILELEARISKLES